VSLSASQEQTLSGRGARVYTEHRDSLGVVTDISAASTGGVLVLTRMWTDAQRDGRPAEYKWRPLFNAAKFG